MLYWNIPDTHFTKWSHYLTALALIGHLISLALTTQRCRCQVNWAWSLCEAVGKHSVNRFMWKDSVGVSGQDAVLPL